jgi:hypothetical protein
MDILLGSEVGTFIFIRNLEVFGGQSYHFGEDLKGSSCLSCYVASCTPVF